MIEQNPRKSSTRKGFNLIESAIVLGVVGLVIGGIWVAAAAVSENHKIEQALSGILLIKENVQKLYHGQFDASGGHGLSISTGVFNNVDGFTIPNPPPVDVYLGVTSPLDPFGEVLSGSAVVNMGGYMGFQTSYINVPTDRCIKLVSAVASRFHDNTDLEFIYLYHADGSDDTLTEFPVIPTAAQCQTDDGGSVGFSFKLN